ncbi:ABC transporter substrate-binding protein [Bradyrhizobium sp.]|uniref:ABC transporter substrate-binding protein n=1 Tax=Bradyrhizobium sp. TaxID=376 RepID=UPI001D97E994|nr:ABC transporter substrate-binding protein [Bradyrhizobium sp.]MBI5322358.1 ABC transporter substrate-binding protein [Bradyrhizobium sp.]
MNRREFIALSAAATVATVSSTSAIAQRSEPTRRIGALFSGGFGQSGAPVFRELERLGWVKDRNIHIEERLYGNETARMRSFAAELAKLSLDAILASSPIEAKALQLETSTVPIVFVIGVDPVSQGVVDSLARPGHNITGCSSFDFSMGGKWAQSLKEIAPNTKRMGIIFNPQAAPYMQSIVRSVEAGARSLQVEVAAIPVLDDAALGQAITSLAQQPDSALVVPPDIFLSARMPAIVALTAQVRLPAIYPGTAIVRVGGLLSYGPDFSDNYRRTAKLVDRILNGAKPADLPVEQPSKFQMAINLKTASLLGLAVPPALLAQADEVID